MCSAGPPILPWPALREFGLQLSEGCMYLAANNIIHGDMKLDNLLMKEDGSLCIADNGEALQLVRYHCC